MTEAEWFECREPEKMLEFLRESGPGSDRKLRLFACACVWDYIRIMSGSGDGVRAGLEVSERYADGLVARDEWWERTRGSYLFIWRSEEAYAEAVSAAETAASVAGWDNVRTFNRPQEDAHRRHECGLLRDIFGNPFRPSPPIDPAWLTWNDSTVQRLAEAAYQERQLPAGTLDPVRLAVLADALEEASCDDAGLLGHLRSEGPHVRGCWALDLLLQKG